VGKVDRTKHAWDVMEHVLGGLRPEDEDDGVPHARVVDLGARGRLLGQRSAVHLTIVKREDDDEPHPR
jgi:hypothetical protein